MLQLCLKVIAVLMLLPNLKDYPDYWQLNANKIENPQDEKYANEYSQDNRKRTNKKGQNTSKNLLKIIILIYN